MTREAKGTGLSNWRARVRTAAGDRSDSCPAHLCRFPLKSDNQSNLTSRLPWTLALSPLILCCSALSTVTTTCVDTEVLLLFLSWNVIYYKQKYNTNLFCICEQNHLKKLYNKNCIQSYIINNKIYVHKLWIKSFMCIK